MRTAIILLAPLVLAVNASAGPIQTIAFCFAEDGGPAYRYVSGDIQFEATAELTGNFILEYDTVSGEASISQIEGSLHSAQQTVGAFPIATDWLEGADLESEVPGLFDGMTGVRTGPMEFIFSTLASPHRALTYRTEFLLSIDPTDLRLSGKAEFNGMDGATMHLNAPLVAIPEPASFVLAMVVGVASFARIPIREWRNLARET